VGDGEDEGDKGGRAVEGGADVDKDGDVGSGDERDGRKVKGVADDGKGISISSPAKIQSGQQTVWWWQGSEEGGGGGGDGSGYNLVSERCVGEG